MQGVLHKTMIYTQMNLFLAHMLLFVSVIFPPVMLKCSFSFILQLPISPESTNDPMCLRDCSNARHKPLCGSDDRTYSSSCELKRVKACLGRKIKVKHKGPCVAGELQK